MKVIRTVSDKDGEYETYGVMEPNPNTTRVGDQGVGMLVRVFGTSNGSETTLADLIIGNNVLAHVPDLNDFVSGMKALLAPRGVITIEFPHLLRMMQRNQFDTIYHEHFSYFSFIAVQRVFAHHGLTLFDVEELPTHGGSLRIYARHAEDDSRPVGGAVDALLETEHAAGFDKLESYLDFEARVHRTKRELLKFLIQAREEGKRIVAHMLSVVGRICHN